MEMIRGHAAADLAIKAADFDYVSFVWEGSGCITSLAIRCI